MTRKLTSYFDFSSRAWSDTPGRAALASTLTLSVSLVPFVTMAFYTAASPEAAAGLDYLTKLSLAPPAFIAALASKRLADSSYEPES